MTPWRLLPFAWNGPAGNMAVDEALLRLAEKPTLRLYGWRPGALSIGYAQQTPEDWKAPIVRRLTGGGAIWHEREVTYSLAGHEDGLAARNDIRGLYARAHAGIVKALGSLGVQARVKEEGKPRSKDDPFGCFQKAASGDVLAWRVDGAGRERAGTARKIAGSAQRRLRKRLLMHGSVMLARDDRNGAGGTGILEVLGREVEPEALAEALARGYAEAFGVEIVRGSLSEAEEALAERLLTKYESEAWTRRKDAREADEALADA